MNCKTATESYEAWLAKHTAIVEADLLLKHQQMSADIFSFMRATFYRWAELFTDRCAELAKAPAVLAVGDLHVANFGTWRDQEARLVWGINDFDEAFSLPYTNDLVRLAVSAHLAISADRLAISPGGACEAILKGYARGLKDGGRPYVLEDRHEWLRSTVMNQLRDPAKFWEKLNGLPRLKSALPAKAKKALGSALPEKKMKYRVARRVAGVGSLGRPRFVALAELNKSLIARELKALAPSACVWASGREDDRSQYGTIVEQAIRCPDPFLQLHKAWVVRRLAPDCSRVELSMLPKGREESKLLEAMGRETANVHLGSGRAMTKVKRDFNKRRSGWLHDARKTMVQATTQDWREWCSES